MDIDKNEDSDNEPIILCPKKRANEGEESDAKKPFEKAKEYELMFQVDDYKKNDPYVDADGEEYEPVSSDTDDYDFTYDAVDSSILENLKTNLYNFQKPLFKYSGQDFWGDRQGVFKRDKAVTHEWEACGELNSVSDMDKKSLEDLKSCGYSIIGDDVQFGDLIDLADYRCTGVFVFGYNGGDSMNLVLKKSGGEYGYSLPLEFSHAPPNYYENSGLGQRWIDPDTLDKGHSLYKKLMDDAEIVKERGGGRCYDGNDIELMHGSPKREFPSGYLYLTSIMGDEIEDEGHWLKMNCYYMDSKPPYGFRDTFDWPKESTRYISAKRRKKRFAKIMSFWKQFFEEDQLLVDLISNHTDDIGSFLV